MNNELNLKKTLLEYEKMFIDNQHRKNPVTLKDLIADDFFEYGSSGKVYNKQSVLSDLPKMPVPNMDIVDFNINILSIDYAFVTFKIVVINDGKAVDNSLRSSIWKRIDNQWKLFFHQGTRII